MKILSAIRTGVLCSQEGTPLSEIGKLGNGTYKKFRFTLYSSCFIGLYRFYIGIIVYSVFLNQNIQIEVMVQQNVKQ